MVNLFARQFGLTDQQAYRYIKRYGGIDLMDKNYDIIHTLDPYQTVNDISVYCRRFGGTI